MKDVIMIVLLILIIVSSIYIMIDMSFRISINMSFHRYIIDIITAKYENSEIKISKKGIITMIFVTKRNEKIFSRTFKDNNYEFFRDVINQDFNEQIKLGLYGDLNPELARMDYPEFCNPKRRRSYIEIRSANANDIDRTISVSFVVLYDSLIDPESYEKDLEKGMYFIQPRIVCAGKFEYDKLITFDLSTKPNMVGISFNKLTDLDVIDLDKEDLDGENSEGKAL